MNALASKPVDCHHFGEPDAGANPARAAPGAALYFGAPPQNPTFILILLLGSFILLATPHFALVWAAFIAIRPPLSSAYPMLYPAPFAPPPRLAHHSLRLLRHRLLQPLSPLSLTTTALASPLVCAGPPQRIAWLPPCRARRLTRCFTPSSCPCPFTDCTRRSGPARSRLCARGSPSCRTGQTCRSSTLRVISFTFSFLTPSRTPRVCPANLFRGPSARRDAATACCPSCPTSPTTWQTSSHRHRRRNRTSLLMIRCTYITIFY